MRNLQNSRHLLIALAGLMFVPISLQASERKLDAHEHGVSALKIAQEGKTFEFELEAPGNDIVGFEHAAENSAQKLAVEKALDQFGKPEAIFILPSNANCEPSNQKAEFETEGDHAGFHVSWTMKCEIPANAKSMETRFFDIFERAEEVEVEAIGNAGQTAIEVEKGQMTVDLSKAIGG